MRREHHPGVLDGGARVRQAGSRAGTSMTGAGAEDGPEHAGESKWRERRRDGLEVGATSRDRGGEGSTRGAVAEMAADASPAQHAPVALGDHAAHLLTGHRATLCKLEQSLASLEDSLLGGAHRESQGERDLLVREAAELAHHQRPARPVAELATVAYRRLEACPV